MNENIKQQNKINEQHNENIKQLLTMIYAHITDYTVHVKDNEEGKYTDYNGVKIQNYTIKDVMKDIASGMYDIRENKQINNDWTTTYNDIDWVNLYREKIKLNKDPKFLDLYYLYCTKFFGKKSNVKI